MARSYEERKKQAREIQAQQSLEGRDIAPLPKFARKWATLKKKCRLNLELFLTTFMPATFCLPFGPDQKTAIAKLQTVLLQGGREALAMPRGSGKTSIFIGGSLWAAVYGHRRFILLLGASAARARDLISSIKTELETNPSLSAAFPEVCHAIHRLEGIANRARGQLFQGNPTHVALTSTAITLPIIPKSPASGVVIRSQGLTAALRGLTHKDPLTRKTIRPDVVLLDDPQDDRSAFSPSDVERRERLVSGAVLGLGGPGKKISALAAVTVIAPDDLADRILDRKVHPDWQGQRYKILYSFPTNTALWDTYAEIRGDAMRDSGEIAPATAFYKEHQAEMEKGAIVAWEHRYNPDEISAIQHAMNLYLSNPQSFASEYQNEPRVKRIEGTIEELSADAVANKLSHFPRGIVAPDAQFLTAGVDIQQNALFFVVTAWAADFTGSVVDCGAWPDLGRPYFSLADYRQDLGKSTGKSTIEAGIHAALEALFRGVIAQPFAQQSGATMQVGKALIDANWAISTETVYQFCQRSGYAAIAQPSRGFGVTAGRKPMGEYRPDPVVRAGLNWREFRSEGRPIRHCLFDTNFWKSFCHARLSVDPGQRGGLTLFGTDAVQHRLMASHLTAEYRTKTTGLGRECDEWHLRAERPDNHLFDCVVMSAVAASMLGSMVSGTGMAPQPRKIWTAQELRDQARKKMRPAA